MSKKTPAVSATVPAPAATNAHDAKAEQFNAGRKAIESLQSERVDTTGAAWNRAKSLARLAASLAGGRQKCDDAAFGVAVVAAAASIAEMAATLNRGEACEAFGELGDAGLDKRIRSAVRRFMGEDTADATATLARVERIVRGSVAALNVREAVKGGERADRVARALLGVTESDKAILLKSSL
jgi:hypothetical protein